MNFSTSVKAKLLVGAVSLLTSNAAVCGVVPVNTEAQLAEQLKKNELVVVKFFSKDCGPCRTIRPWFDELSDEYPNITFVSADVREEALAKKHHISSVPAIKFFKNGEKVTEFTGAEPTKEAFRAKVRNIINTKLISKAPAAMPTTPMKKGELKKEEPKKKTKMEKAKPKKEAKPKELKEKKTKKAKMPSKNEKSVRKVMAD